MAAPILGVVGAVIGGIFGAVAGGPAGAAAGAQAGWMIGYAIGTYIDPPHTPGPKLGEAAVQTSRDGLVIPILWGIHHLTGNIIAMNPIIEITKKVSLKGHPGTTTITTRTRTFAIGMCRSARGPIGSILRVWENHKLIYDARPGSVVLEPDANSLFLEGVSIYLGTENQLPDADLETETGVGSTPAYRGLAYIVFHNKDITLFGSSVPSYRFELNTGEGYQSKDYPADP